MSGGSSRPPPAPDPERIIEAQTRANRVGRTGPFGSALYGTDENGGAVVNTTLSPEMQALVGRQFARAQQDTPRIERPEGFGQLQSAMLGQAMGGIGGNRLSNFQAAQQNGAPPEVVRNHFKPEGTRGLPHPDPSLNPQRPQLPPGY